MLSKLKILRITVFLLIVYSNGCHEQTKTDKGQDSSSVESHDTTNIKSVIGDTANLPKFNGENAKNIIAEFCKFGPRNPNSIGAKQACNFIVNELKKYSDVVNEQKFVIDGYDGVKLNLTNVIATFNPDAKKRILICCHWDSRPRAEEDTDPTKKQLPILGANDGGSGVGVMIELAKLMKQNKPNIGVDLVFFDGEDYGKEGDLENYFLGAKYFANNLPNGFKPSFGILLDLVGDPNSFFEMEGNSMKYAQEVNVVVWNGAKELGISRFKHKLGNSISDDHLALNEIAKIPTIDIIDIELVGNNSTDVNRQYWHTHNDTMDKISAQSLEDIGRVLVYTIYELINR